MCYIRVFIWYENIAFSLIYNTIAPLRYAKDIKGHTIL